jgi:hypothetical protein
MLMSWLDLLWNLFGYPSGGLPEKDVARRYLATAVIAALMIGATTASWWAFVDWNIIVATIACIASFVIAFVVALWAVGRILPRKIHLDRSVE